MPPGDTYGAVMASARRRPRFIRARNSFSSCATVQHRQHVARRQSSVTLPGMPKRRRTRACWIVARSPVVVVSCQHMMYI